MEEYRLAIVVAVHATILGVKGYHIPGIVDPQVVSLMPWHSQDNWVGERGVAMQGQRETLLGT